MGLNVYWLTLVGRTEESWHWVPVEHGWLVSTIPVCRRPVMYPAPRRRDSVYWGLDGAAPSARRTRHHVYNSQGIIGRLVFRRVQFYWNSSYSESRYEIAQCYLPTCHPTQVNTSRFNTSQRPVLDLPTQRWWHTCFYAFTTRQRSRHYFYCKTAWNINTVTELNWTELNWRLSWPSLQCIKCSSWSWEIGNCFIIYFDKFVLTEKNKFVVSNIWDINISRGQNNDTLFAVHLLTYLLTYLFTFLFTTA